MDKDQLVLGYLVGQFLILGVVSGTDHSGPRHGGMSPCSPEVRLLGRCLCFVVEYVPLMVHRALS